MKSICFSTASRTVGKNAEALAIHGGLNESSKLLEYFFLSVSFVGEDLIIFDQFDPLVDDDSVLDCFDECGRVELMFKLRTNSAINSDIPLDTF